MEQYIIKGGNPLVGEVEIGGAKNAALAILAAAIMTDEAVHIENLPDVRDINVLLEAIREIGATVDRISPTEVRIVGATIGNITVEYEYIKKIRASYYLLGALLGKYKNAEVPLPGGCNIGSRPIDQHLKGFRALGASVDIIHGAVVAKAEELRGKHIFLDMVSVGATINIMMAAVYAKGRTVIENAAREPEIIDIATLLNKMGARIHGMGTSTLTIDGVERLGGCMHEIIPDRIEASTYLIIAAAMADTMRIENIIPQHVEAITMKLKEIGIQMKVESDAIEVYKTEGPLKPTDILTKPYPGFATDVQQPFTALLTRAQGQSVVTETIYTERFKHCYELNKMGADIDVRVPSSFINGNTPLTGTSVTATDLRCGACLVIAALMAEGVTEIHDVYHIDRGYEDLDGKLKSLGAVLWREEVE